MSRSKHHAELSAAIEGLRVAREHLKCKSPVDLEASPATCCNRPLDAEGRCSSCGCSWAGKGSAIVPAGGAS